MVQGLLFNGISSTGNELAIGEGHQLTGMILADLTDTCLSIFNFTTMGTEITLHRGAL
jgi:hypothetical protein